MKRLLCALGAAAAVLACALGASGSVHGNGPAALTPDEQIAIVLDSPRIPKLDSRLAELATIARTKSAATALATAKDVGVDVTAGRLRVIVESDDPAAAGDAVLATGGKVEATAGDLTRAEVAPGDLVALTQEPVIGYVRPPFDPVPEAVPTDEGVASTNAKVWHGRGQTGTGQKIAIVDVGFAGYTTAGLGSVITADCTVSTTCAGGLTPAFTSTNHGTAVAAVAHAMAPGAQLYLVAIADEVDLANAEKFLKGKVKIVNHSIGWFNTDRGDGTLGKNGNPASTVAKAKTDGILWVNAAGDHAQNHWSGTWADSNGDKILDFAPDDDGETFTLAVGKRMCAYLKWDDWPKADRDHNFDLYLYRTTGFPIATASVTFQQGQEPPVESLCYQNQTDATETLNLRIFYTQRPGGPAQPEEPPRFDLFLTGEASVPQYANSDGSIPEPASSPDALAVGAACRQTGAVEPYSSRGPTIGGATKPDIVGPDSVSNVVAGAASGCGTGFTGTSASAPHAAGAAALALQNGTPVANVKDYLIANAHDIDPVGPDNDTGAGRLRLPVSPTISGFSPPSGPVGTVVTLSGTDLGGTTSVRFGAVATSVPTSVANIAVKATVPVGAMSSTLDALGPDAPVPVSAQIFHVTPLVQGFTPTTGVPGTPVTITGHTFTGVTDVKFGTLLGTDVHFVDDDTVTAKVPDGATTSKITVVADGQGTSTGSFTVIQAPSISTVSPTKAAVGALVTVTGLNLDSVTTATLFDTVPVDALTHVGATKLTFRVPAGAVDGDLRLTNPRGVATKPFVVLPSITHITDHASPGASIQIDGYNLGPSPVVKVNGVTAVLDSNTPSTLRQVFAIVPGSAKTGKITVTTTTGTATSSATFNVVLAPTISSFSPAFGAIGATVTVNGANLTYVDTVTLNDLPVDALAHSGSTKLTFKVPANATAGVIHVQNTTGPGADSKVTTPFRIVPRVDGFSPNHKPVDGDVTINGLNLDLATKVTFNGKAGTIVGIPTETSLVAKVPSGATSGKIGVASAVGGTTSSGIFTVVGKPTVTSFTPASAAVGATITLTGTNLQYATKVRFPNGGESPVLAGATQTSLKTTVPSPYAGTTLAEAAGGLVVLNEEANFTSLKSTMLFKLLPGVTVQETEGILDQVIHFHGTNVQSPLPVTKVTFNGIPATAPEFQGDSDFTVHIPPKATTGKIAITTVNGTVTLPRTFTVIPAPTITSFSPAAAPVGGTLTINGTGVGFATHVFVNEGEATITSARGASPLKVRVPGDVTPTGTITVVSAAGQVSKTTFKVIPTISGTSVSDAAAEGAAFVVNGAGFGKAGSPTPTVTLSGKPIPQNSGSFTSITINATVPVGATSGSLVVTTAGGTATRAFKVKPAISGFNPPHSTVGPVTGGPLTITGTTFGGTTSVKVGGVAATFKLVNATTITVASIPSTAVTGPVTVTTAAGTASSANDFVVDPKVTTLNPTHGATGSTITVSGSGFYGTPQVLFGAGHLPSPSVTNVTANSLKAVVPDGADLSSVVRVETADGGADGPSFTVDFGIVNFTPDTGPAGTEVVISGAGFTGATGLKFGTVAVTSTDWTVTSPTSITAHVPAGDADGKITVVKGAASVVSAGSFTVAEPPPVTVASQKIVFARTNCADEDIGDCGIFIMNGDGTGRTQLTVDTGAAEDRVPALSADGTKVAFARENQATLDRTIWTMTSTGGSKTQLTTGDRPAWNPIGTTIAFDDLNEDDDQVLWTIGSDGAGRTQITDVNGDKGAKWAPVGSTLAFVRDPGTGGNDVETLSPVTSAGTVTEIVSKTTTIRAVEWSPDGTKLLYTVPATQTIPPLHKINLDKTDDMVASTDANATSPSWTHCSRIVVDGIAVLREDGTGRTPITSGFADVEPSCWEPHELGPQ